MAEMPPTDMRSGKFATNDIERGRLMGHIPFDTAMKNRNKRFFSMIIWIPPTHTPGAVRSAEEIVPFECVSLYRRNSPQSDLKPQLNRS